jgi:hypothetical protein
MDVVNLTVTLAFPLRPTRHGHADSSTIKHLLPSAGQIVGVPWRQGRGNVGDREVAN